MRRSPPVSLDTSTPAAWRRGVDLLAWLSCVALTTWVVTHGRHDGAGLPWAPAALAVAGIALNVWSCLRARTLPAGLLAWDGQTWHWQAHGTQVSGQHQRVQQWQGLQVVLDQGSWMLLRTPPQAGTRWLAVEHGASAGAWHLMRCAVYSSGSTTSALAARPAVTTPPGTPTIPHER